MTEEEPKQEEKKKPFYKKLGFWIVTGIIMWIGLITTFGILKSKNIFNTWWAFGITLTAPFIFLLIYGIIHAVKGREEKVETETIDITKKAKKKCREEAKNILKDTGYWVDIKDFLKEDISPKGEVETKSYMIYSLIIPEPRERFCFMVAMRVDNTNIQIVEKTKGKLPTKSELNDFEKKKRELAKAFRETMKVTKKITKTPLGLETEEEIREPAVPTLEVKPEVEEPLGTK